LPAGADDEFAVPRCETPSALRTAVDYEGFNLEASVRIDGDDDLGRERLCRYGARPALALARLRRLPGGRIAYRVKKLGRGRAKTRVMTPLELLARLCALIPPPRYPLVRYHGVLAPRSPWRRDVVPRPRDPTHPTTPCAKTGDERRAAPRDAAPPSPPPPVDRPPLDAPHTKPKSPDRDKHPLPPRGRTSDSRFRTCSVFFLYRPFGGERLARVLGDLEHIARTRELRVCCIDLPLPRAPG